MTEGRLEDLRPRHSTREAGPSYHLRATLTREAQDALHICSALMSKSLPDTLESLLTDPGYGARILGQMLQMKAGVQSPLDETVEAGDASGSNE